MKLSLLKKNLPQQGNYLIIKRNSWVSSSWKRQLKETALWEERYILVLKIESIKNPEEKDFYNKRLLYIDECLSQIKKEIEDLKDNNAVSPRGFSPYR